MQIEVIRSRRKTIAIHITHNCTVQVRAPQHLTNSDIQRFLEQKASWIAENLDKLSAQCDTPKLTDEELHRLTDAARQDLSSRCARFAPAVQVTYGRISIRHQLSRWGSCSAKGNLNFNCLLMLAPEEIRDYVVVHELCHRKHMNHSPAFWNEVGKILPHYPVQRRWLKEHGTALIAKLPK